MCTPTNRNQRRSLTLTPSLTLACPLTLALSHQGRGED